MYLSDVNLLFVDPVVLGSISKEFFVDVVLPESQAFTSVIAIVGPAFVSKFLIWKFFVMFFAVVPVEFCHRVGLDAVFRPRVKVLVINTVILMTLDPMPLDLQR